MMSRLMRLAAMLCVVVSPALLDAQRGGGRGRGQVPPDVLLGQLVRQQLQLTDTQASRLQETNNRFLSRRQALGAEEREVRVSMRDLLCSADTTRGPEMARLIDRWHELAARRLALQQEEQREMSAFLSPYQRARWLALEERVRARTDQLLGGRGGRGGPGGPGDRAGGGGGPPDGPPPGGRGGRRGGGPPPMQDLCGPAGGQDPVAGRGAPR